MAADYATLKKGGFMRQKQKNNFSLRLAVVGGQLTTKQLAVITEVADKYGHGYVHLTSRQSVEIPFIKLEDVENVKKELEVGGVKPGVCGPRVRTITACQGSLICPNGCIETEELAKELDERYFGKELPHKFKFGVTGCQNNRLKAEEKAITIEDNNITIDRDKCNYCGRCAFSCPTDAYDLTPGYLISFGGLFGNTINKGEGIVPFIEDKEVLFKVCDAALDFFKDNANSGERFKFTIDRIGKDKLEEVVWSAYNE